MIFQPFRQKASEDEDSLADVYEFLVFGTKGIDSKPYQVEIEVDNVNETGLVETRCTCPDATFRQRQCKHIVTSLKILKDFGVDCELKTLPNTEMKQYEFGVMTQRYKLEGDDEIIAKVAMCMFMKTPAPIAIYSPVEEAIDPTKMLKASKEHCEKNREKLIKCYQSIQEHEQQ